MTADSAAQQPQLTLAEHMSKARAARTREGFARSTKQCRAAAKARWKKYYAAIAAKKELRK